MLIVGDQLVSWGKDGTLRFWSFHGAALYILAVPRGFYSVHIHSNRIIALARTLWIYDMQWIKFS